MKLKLTRRAFGRFLLGLPAVAAVAGAAAAKLYGGPAAGGMASVTEVDFYPSDWADSVDEAFPKSYEKGAHEIFKNARVWPPSRGSMRG